MKAPDAVVNVIDFIEEQLSKSFKKTMFRLRNCIRYEVWLRCLTAISQRPDTSSEVDRRIKGIKMLYPSQEWIMCSLCTAINALFYATLFVIDCIRS